MDLTIRYTLLLVATLAFTLASLVIFVAPRYFRGIYRYNDAIIHILGVAEDNSKMVQWIIKWVLSSCIATLSLSLVVNIIDTFFLVTGQSGVSFDPVIMPIAIMMICFSIFLLIAASLPILAIPPSCPTALAILTVLQLYGVHYVLGLHVVIYNILAFGSTLLYFLAIGIGVVGNFISVYVLLRRYLAVKISGLMKREAAP